MSDDAVWLKSKWLLSETQTRVVFDVGANVGDMTARFLTDFPEAVVYAFEPLPEPFARLEELIGQERRAQLVNSALTSTIGEQTMHIAGHDSASSLYPRNETSKRYFLRNLGMIGQAEVQTTTLDQFCADNGIEHIHYLKMDIQGGEYEALRGAQRMLSGQAVDVITAEFFCVPHYEGAPLLDSIWSLLRSHGYDLYNLYMFSYGSDGQARWGDAIFISRKHRARFLDRLPEEP